MTIEQRVAKLEKQNRWMKRMGGLAVAAVACVVLMGQGKAKELPDLVAKSLTIKDRHGKTRASLTMGRGAIQLALHNKKGDERAMLEVTGEGVPLFLLMDVWGTNRAKLIVPRAGGPEFGLYNRGGGVSLTATDRGVSLLTLRDLNGAARLRLAASLGLSSLVLRDKLNKPRISLEVGRAGPASLTLLDRAGQTRVVLGAKVFKTPENTLTLLDAKGNVVWKAPK